TGQPESVSHISKELGVLQESVYRSVELLIKNGYLAKDDKYTIRKKEIVVTPKGAALAVLLGATTNQLVKYLNRRKKYDESEADTARYFEGFTRMANIKDPSKQNLLVREMMEYLLEQDDYFNEAGRVAKSLSQEEQKGLMEYLVIRYRQAVGQPRTIKDV